MSTGLRREEVIGFRGRDIQITEEGLGNYLLDAK
jgi:hypothetical protein